MTLGVLLCAAIAVGWLVNTVADIVSRAAIVRMTELLSLPDVGWRYYLWATASIVNAIVFWLVIGFGIVCLLERTV